MAQRPGVRPCPDEANGAEPHRHIAAVLGVLIILALSACRSGAPAAPPEPTAPSGMPRAIAAPRPVQPGSTATSGAAAAPSAAELAALPSIADIPRAQPGQEEVIVATTTSTQDSGLLDVLVPMFEQATGYHVKTIAVGTGQSLALGARGEADVVLVHAPEAEQKWMADGNGAERRLVMHNDFVVVGPPEDPAGIRGAPSAEIAFQKIAEVRAPFISRGDDSGTQKAELAIWKSAGLEPKGQSWYQESGQGMGATLNIADEKRAYTLADRGTYLARQRTLHLEILVQGAKALLNVYHVMPVNPGKFPRVNTAGGRAFAEFLVSREVQATIASFGADKFGQPLFFADAGKPDDS